IRFQEPDQHPMSVHRRMPVKTTVKGWVHRARALDISGVVDCVIRFVRIFPGYALQGERGKMRGLLLCERRMSRGSFVLLKSCGAKLRLWHKKDQGQQS